MLLELKKITKSYLSIEGRSEAPVLREISLEVHEGDTIAIVGPSGSGKSTLLNIMGALDRPTSGSVVLNGRDLSGLSDKELARVRNHDIGFVFQEHHLLPQCTALENVLIPTLAREDKRQGDSPEYGIKLLENIGLANRMHYRPGQLSGGECQRVALVRALINRPGLVLADEPTGSLDPENALNLADLLAGINKEGVALVMVTHSMELADRMSVKYRLHRTLDRMA